MPDVTPACLVPEAALRWLRRWLVPLLGLGVMALLSGCASGPHLNPENQAANYRAHTHFYPPPGPASDPWGPYIADAAHRFDVPERWIREVMRVESGGHEYLHGEPVTSPTGAMGLMQIMPATYEELRAQYHLGSDPYDPRNSIMAGTAYIREMYDIYGSPGFLAAYNAGPQRLEEYLTDRRPLPRETRNYVAMIAPYIRNSWPVTGATGTQYANAMSFDVPPDRRRYARNARFAQQAHSAPQPVRVASVVRPPIPRNSPFGPTPPAGQVREVAQSGRRGFRLISSAMAATVPLGRGGMASGDWAVQVGAYGNVALAHHALLLAHEHAARALVAGHPLVMGVSVGRVRLYRARLTGLSHSAAVQACEELRGGRTGCTVLSPEAQS